MKPHGAVVARLQDIGDGDLYISVVTVGEIQAGIEVTRERDDYKANGIEFLLACVTATHGLLPMGTADSRTCDCLMHRTSDTLYENAKIASTALGYDLTIVTRDVRDFGSFGVRLLNPFAR